MNLFANKYKSEYLKLKSLIEQVNFSSFDQSQKMLFLDNGESVPLFNLSENLEIIKAVKSVPELNSILNYIAKSFASGDFLHFRNNKLIENSAIIKVLNAPHELFSGQEFKTEIAKQLFSFGIAYIFVKNNGIRSKPQNFYVLPSANVKIRLKSGIAMDNVLLADNSIIDYFEVKQNNSIYKIDKASVIFATYNNDFSISDNYLKIKSPLTSLSAVLSVSTAIYEILNNLYNNYGMKGFIANKTTDAGSYMPIKSEEKKNIEQYFKNYGLKNGQNQIAFTSFDLNYIPISSPINELNLSEVQKMIKTQIADVLGFDTAILNNDAANKYANYNEARKSLFTENLIPVANGISRCLNDYLFKFSENEEIKIDYSKLDIFSENEIEKIKKIETESKVVITLNSAVAKNEMKRENAIEFLILNGYNEQTAKKLIF